MSRIHSLQARRDEFNLLRGRWNVEQMAAALRIAKRVIARERREQFASFTVPPHRNTPEAYAAMCAGERRAIRSFDRAIAKINEALK